MKKNNAEDSILDDVEQLSTNLRKKLLQQLTIFWQSNDSCSMEKVFFINSVAFSSVLADMVSSMFNGEPEAMKVQLEYIDEVAKAAKQQLLICYSKLKK